MIHGEFFDLSGKVFFTDAVRIGKDSNEGKCHGCQQNECGRHLLHAPYAIILHAGISDLSRKVSHDNRMSKQFVNDVVSVTVFATCWHEVPLPPLEGEVVER